MNNHLKLLISIFMDLFGFMSYTLPVIGEVSDLIFAPIQGLWIMWAYKTPSVAVLGVVEEILPGTDFIPSCLIAHFGLHKKLGLP